MDYKKQHWYYIASKLISGIKELVVWLIIVGVSFRKTDISFIFILILLVSIGIGTSILGWIREKYLISDNMIYAKKGIFTIKDISIPIEKVHSVDISSSFVQGLLNVCRIDIETSGGGLGEKEFSILVLKNEALNIKSKIINRDFNEEDIFEIDNNNSNYKLSIKDILIASLTSTQITIGFSAILALFTFFNDYIPKDYQEEFTEKADMYIEGAIGTGIFYKILFILIIFLVLSFILSFVGMTLKYYNFNVSRCKDIIKIRYGLLNYKEVNIPVDKILYIDIKEGLLRKPIGFCEVKLASFGYGNESGEKAVLFPLIKKHKLQNLIDEVIPEVSIEYKIQGVMKESLPMYICINSVHLFILSGIVSYYFEYGLISIIVPLLAVYLSILKFKENGVGFNENLTFIRIRKLALHNYIVPNSKIQSLEVIKNKLSRHDKIRRVKIDIQDTVGISIQSIRGMNVNICEELLELYK